MAALGVLLHVYHAVGRLRLNLGTHLAAAHVERVLQVLLASSVVVHLLLNVIADLGAAHQSRLLLLSVPQLRASARLLTVHDAERAACVRIVRITSRTSGSLL